jgi:hypothetical protein
LGTQELLITENFQDAGLITPHRPLHHGSPRGTNII